MSTTARGQYRRAKDTEERRKRREEKEKKRARREQGERRGHSNNTATLAILILTSAIWRRVERSKKARGVGENTSKSSTLNYCKQPSKHY